MNACVKEARLQEYAGTPYKKNKRSYIGTAEILISEMTITDVPKVHALECRSHSFPWSQTIISDCISSRYQCWMMRRSDRVIAYGIMALGVEESHLLNLCVDPDFRRQGYAGYMIRFLSDIAIVQNAKRMFLEVRESNYQAVGLYRKLGFRQVSRRSDYYPTETNREAALVLAKLL